MDECKMNQDCFQNITENLDTNRYRGMMSKGAESLNTLEDRLFLALYQGNVKAVRSLIKKGANLNSISSSGRTPLGTAAHVGNVEILKILLSPSPLSSPTVPTVLDENDVGVTHSLKGPAWQIEYQRKSENVRNPPERVLSTEACNNETSSTTGIRSMCSGNVGGFGNEDEDSKIFRGIHQVRCKGNIEFEDDIIVSEKCDEEGCDKTKAQSWESDISDNNSYCSDRNSDFESGIDKNRFESNQGYYIVIHNDCSNSDGNEDVEDSKPNGDENLNEPKTPDDMDNLEWDLELQNDEDVTLCEESEESDSWVDLYRWYADYLASTCPIVNSLKHCLPSKVDVNQLDIYHRSAMHYAAEQGRMDGLRLLINAGCHVDIGDSDDVTPLHLAAAHDYPDAVLLLITCGAKVNRRSIDRTGPLHMAAARGYMQTARILLEHGANVNALDQSDRTPLMLAVSRGLADVAQLLIHHGAKVNLEDIHGYTPLCQAVWQQEKELVGLLLEAGAKLTHSDRLLHYAILHRCTDIAELLIAAGSVVNLRDDNGDTPLIIAARSGQVNIADMLLRNGAIADYPNGLTGSTPLHEAVQSLRPAQHQVLRALILTLLKYGAHLNLESSPLLDTPLVRALVHERDRAMVLLIQFGADVNLLQQHTPVVSDAYLKQRPDRWIIAQLMVCAGLDLWRYTPDIKFGVQYPSESPLSWIAHMKFNPMSLMGLSRLQFRSHFREHLFMVVNGTILPPSLKKFLMLEDAVRVEDI